jgi:hypothetical protein
MFKNQVTIEGLLCENVFTLLHKYMSNKALFDKHLDELFRLQEINENTYQKYALHCIDNLDISFVLVFATFMSKFGINEDIITYICSKTYTKEQEYYIKEVFIKIKPSIPERMFNYYIFLLFKNKNYFADEFLGPLVRKPFKILYLYIISSGSIDIKQLTEDFTKEDMKYLTSLTHDIRNEQMKEYHSIIDKLSSALN